MKLKAGQKTSFLCKAAMLPELWFYTCPHATEQQS